MINASTIFFYSLAQAELVCLGLIKYSCVLLQVRSRCLKPTFILYKGGGLGLSGHWVHLIIDCQIKSCSSLESSLTPTSICLHLEQPLPPPRPFIQPPLQPPPPHFLSTLSVAPSFPPSHQHHFSWRANNCLTVMALKAKQGASRCEWVRACVCACTCVYVLDHWEALRFEEVCTHQHQPKRMVYAHKHA